MQGNRFLTKILFIICVALAPVAQWCSTAYAQDIFDPYTLHEIRIEIAQTGWFDTLDQWYDASLDGSAKQFMAAGITIDGNTLKKSSGIRFKGQYSNTGFPGLKKPFRIHFNKFSDKQDYEGIKKINLHNLAGDPSFLREFVSYDMLRYAGIAAPRVSFTKLFINNTYWGCYLIAEEPEDKLFLKQNFNTDEGNLFDNADDTRMEWRGADPLLYPELKLQTKDKAGAWDKLLEWIKLFNTCFDYDFQQRLYEKFDIDGYLKVLAMDVFLNNWDSYADNGRNYFIYDNPETGKLHWIPWDYNLAMWKKNLALFPKDNDSKYNYKPLIWRISENEFLKEKYYKTFCTLLNKVIDTYPLEEKTTAITSLIRDAVEADTMKFFSNDAFHKNRTEGVTVNMLRSSIATDVWLPGITSLLSARKDTLRALLKNGGCACNTVTDDNEVPGVFIKIFPNPVTSTLTIYTEERDDSVYPVEVMMYDKLGRQVKHISLGTIHGTTQLDVTDMPDGIYTLKIQLHSKTTITRIVKI